MSESFAALFEESLQRSEMRTGEVITAEVVRIEHSFVVVNAGVGIGQQHGDHPPYVDNGNGAVAAAGIGLPMLSVTG